MEALQNIGFSDWFRSQLDESKSSQHSIARVITVHKDRYILNNGEFEAFAELSGNLLYSTESATDLPTVGDWVYADFYDEETHGIIHGVLPRKTLLKRKTAGKQVDFQLIAANIDVAFIVQSANENFNLRRLERYLVMVNESGIKPVVLLSKSDLLPQSEIEEITERILEVAPETSVIPFSNITEDNLEEIKQSLKAGSTYCLIGSSGVGKTTLLNSILGRDDFETQEVSKKESKGKHTTTNRELILLDNGAMIIDTPGMRELGNLSIDTGLDETFSEILELATQCKFGNCSHTQELGCAILETIESGELSESRYQNYLKMKNEAAFNDMSYLEKKQKGKDLSKLIKTTLKGKPKY